MSGRPNSSDTAASSAATMRLNRRPARKPAAARSVRPAPTFWAEKTVSAMPMLIIGIMLLWNSLYRIIPLYNTKGIMVLAYVTLFLPYTIQYVSSSYLQISPSLLEAGRSFGGGRFYVIRRVVLPLLKRGILSAFSMTFIISFRELVTASLIAPPTPW